MNTLTVQEISKTVINKDLIKEAKSKFQKSLSDNSVGIQTLSSRSKNNFDLDNASLVEMDFKLTDEDALKDLDVVKHLEIPTENGRILYSFNDEYYSIQTFENASEQKNQILDLIRSSEEYPQVEKFLKERKAEIDFETTEVVKSSKVLSDKAEVNEETISVGIALKDKESKEEVGQLQYNDTDEAFNLFLGEESVVFEEGEPLISANSSCIVGWMSCMMRCLCGGTVGSCAIAISGCLGACCSCVSIITCAPCIGCAAGVLGCSNRCGSGK